jgi:hypothetical protein
MKFAPIAAAVLAAAALGAQAQTPPPPPAGAPLGMQHEGHGNFDPARMHQRMQERMQRRMESLKRILQIAPAQEGAWNAWTSAMRPSQQAMQQRGHRGEFARMTTPERLDRMRQMRALRAQEMDRRAEATKSFYAQLTPPQQKAFDEVSLKFFGGRRGHRHGM